MSLICLGICLLFVCLFVFLFVVCFFLCCLFFSVVCKNYYIINIYKYIISYQMVLSNGAQRFEPVGLGGRKRRTMRGGLFATNVMIPSRA